MTTGAAQPRPLPAARRLPGLDVAKLRPAVTALGRTVRRGVEAVGKRGRFLADSARALADASTRRPLVVGQARLLAVDSLPIALFIALFTGSVLALLPSFSFTRAVRLYFVGVLNAVPTRRRHRVGPRSDAPCAAVRPWRTWAPRRRRGGQT